MPAPTPRYPFIVTSDLHLTDKADDAYRWDLFDQLWNMGALQKGSLFILGDLTDRKNNHSADLVNRIVNVLLRMTEVFDSVHLLRGNHDYIDTASPFFAFADNLKGIEYINTACALTDRVYCIPHHHKTADFFYDLGHFNPVPGQLVFMHQTLRGAEIENGDMMRDGIVAETLDDFETKFVSGDIHVPQTIGSLTYCGAPYHIRFGDVYEPRVLMIDADHVIHSVPVDSVSKHLVSINPEEIDRLERRRYVGPVKVRVRLTRAQMHQWPALRQRVRDWAEAKSIQLKAVEPVYVESESSRRVYRGTLPTSQKFAEVVLEYSERNDLPESLTATGLELLDADKPSNT